MCSYADCASPGIFRVSNLDRWFCEAHRCRERDGKCRGMMAPGQTRCRKCLQAQGQGLPARLLRPQKRKRSDKTADDDDLSVDLGKRPRTEDT